MSVCSECSRPLPTVTARSWVRCDSCSEARKSSRCSGCSGPITDPSSGRRDEFRQLWHRECLLSFRPEAVKVADARVEADGGASATSSDTTLNSNPAKPPLGASPSRRAMRVVNTSPFSTYLFHQPPPSPSTAAAAVDVPSTPPVTGAGDEGATPPAPPTPTHGPAPFGMARVPESPAMAPEMSPSGPPPLHPTLPSSDLALPPPAVAPSEAFDPSQRRLTSTDSVAAGAERLSRLRLAATPAAAASHQPPAKRATRRRRHFRRSQLQHAHHTLRPRVDAAAPAGAEPTPRVFYSTTLDHLVQRIQAMGLIGERTHRFKTYPDCLVARELVDFLVTTRQCATRGEGVEMGKLLLDRGYMRHVTDDSNKFADDHLFFKLTLPTFVPRPVLLPPPADAGPNAESMTRTLASAIVQEEYFDHPRGRAGSGYIQPPVLTTGMDAGGVSSSSPSSSSSSAAVGAGGMRRSNSLSMNPMLSHIASSGDTGRRHTAAVLPGMGSPSLATAATTGSRSMALAPPTKQLSSSMSVSRLGGPSVPAVPKVAPLRRGTSSSVLSAKSPPQVAALSPTEKMKKLERRAVKAGFLTKQGHKVKNWKRRWFVLRGKWLMYYRKTSDSTPAGTIDVLDYTLERPEDPTSPLRMRLVSSKEVGLEYLIEADTPRDFVEWAKAISSTITEWKELMADAAQHRTSGDTFASHPTATAPAASGAPSAAAPPPPPPPPTTTTTTTK